MGMKKLGDILDLLFRGEGDGILVDDWIEWSKLSNGL